LRTGLFAAAVTVAAVRPPGTPEGNDDAGQGKIIRGAQLSADFSVCLKKFVN
jgi:hypothetical protein